MGVAWASASGPVVLREQAYRESRSTVAALGATVFNQGPLHWGQFALLDQRFHGIDFLPRYHREEHQAAINWRVNAPGAVLPGVVLPDHDHGAGPAFAFRTTLFGPGQAFRTQKVKECGVQTALSLHTFSVQLKFDDLAGLAIR